MNSDPYRQRRQRLYEHMAEGEGLILFAGAAPRKTADVSYPFFANRNFYYLTGILQTDSVLLAVKSGSGIDETLFVHPKDPMAERWHGSRLCRDEAAERSGVEHVGDLADFDSALTSVLDRGDVAALWYDFDKFDAERLDAPQNRHSASIRAARPDVSIKDAYPPICAARTIKDAGEIAHMREAMTITRDGIHAMMKAAKAGMYEYQLEAVFNKVLADAGVRQPAFASIISGGRNNFYIHYDEPSGVLNDGDLILTDVGARLHEYVNDISRAFPVNGRFTTEQKEVYGIALKVNKELMNLLIDLTDSTRDLYMGKPLNGHLPTEEAVTLALRTQQIIAEESGVADTVDATGGAYIIESLTDELEERARAEMDKIEGMGGVLAAIDSGYIQREIARSAYRKQREMESKQRTTVGVNEYVEDKKLSVRLLKVDDALRQQQMDRLQQMRRTRDPERWQATMDELASAARGDENLMPAILKVVQAEATVGEICGLLTEQFGAYQEPSTI